MFGVVKQASTKTAVKWFYRSRFYGAALKHTKGKETVFKFTPQGWQNFNKSPVGKNLLESDSKGFGIIKYNSGYTANAEIYVQGGEFSISNLSKMRNPIWLINQFNIIEFLYSRRFTPCISPICADEQLNICDPQRINQRVSARKI